jgi:hypothetical protein
MKRELVLLQKFVYLQAGAEAQQAAHLSTRELSGSIALEGQSF